MLRLRRPRKPKYNILLPCAHEFIDGTHHVFGRKFTNELDIWTDIQVFDDEYIVKFTAHYLDFLNSKKMGLQDKLNLLCYYYEVVDSSYLWHPYTSSRRIINLANFLCSYVLSDRDLILLRNILDTEYEYLSNNIEFDIDANHLLTNYCALACSENLLSYSSNFRKKYFAEFMSQFDCGLHYERSFSYHSLMINEFLLVGHLCEEMKEVNKFFMRKDVRKLYAFLFEINSYPQFGDCFSDTFLDDLSNIKCLINLKCNIHDHWFEVGGYYFYSQNDLKVIVDGGTPSPKFQPGHCHSSTFAINVFYKDKEFVTNIGTDSYSRSRKRFQQRSQISYSSPQNPNGTNSQEVWSSFRVGRRRKVTTYCSQNILTIECMGVTRTVEIDTDTIIINDYGAEKTQLIVRDDHSMCLDLHDFDDAVKCLAYKSFSPEYAYECTKFINFSKTENSVMRIDFK